MHDGGCPISHLNKLKVRDSLTKQRANEAFVSSRYLHEGVTQNSINDKRTKERERVQQTGLLSKLITKQIGFCVLSINALFLSFLIYQRLDRLGFS